MDVGREFGSPANANQPRKRVRTGCLSCRRRKKKCDETRPQCRSCLRNHLSCRWPQKRTAYDDAYEEDAEPMDLSACIDSTALPSSRQPVASASASTISPPTISPTISSTISSTAVPSASLTASASAPSASSTPSGAWTLAPSLTPRLRLVQIEPAVPVYELFDRYLHFTAPRLAVYACTQAQNPFVHMLVPVAFYAPIAMTSLLAVAAAHRAAPESRHLYGAVLSSLCTTLDNNQSGTDVLVAVMMLSFFETAEGDSRARALQHLEALVRCLRLRQQDGFETPHDVLAAEVLLYHVVTAGFHSHDAYQILSAWKGRDGPNLRGRRACTWDTVAGSYRHPPTRCMSGLSAELIDVLLEITDLFPSPGGGASPTLALSSTPPRTPPPPSNTTPLDADTIIRGVALAARLDRWAPPPFSASPLPEWLDEPAYRPLQLAALLWKYAAFLNLLLLMHGRTVQPMDGRVAETVAAFMATLAAIPAGDPVETCLNWPLVMVGSYAVRAEHRDLLRARHASMAWLQFKNIDAAGSILEDVWKQYDDNGVIDLHVVLTQPRHDVVLS